MYTVNESGVMNNYAVEPAMYLAEYPSPEQQRNYMLQGAVAVLLVASTVLTALAVS
ncbi:MAG TPA: ssl1498 family light-harvesting-like protein [Stenomitos sp.]